MVETSLSHSLAMITVFDFFGRLEQVKMQILSKRFYDKIIPLLLASKKVYAQKTKPQMYLYTAIDAYEHTHRRVKVPQFQHELEVDMFEFPRAFNSIADKY